MANEDNQKAIYAPPKGAVKSSTTDEVLDAVTLGLYGAFTGEDKVSPPKGAVRSEPTTSETAAAVARGATKGLTESAPITGGVMLGLKGAKYIAPAAGPYAPLVTGTMALGGGTAGYFLGDKLSDMLPERFKQEPDQELYPYYSGGSTFGQAIGYSPMAFNLPTAMAGRISNAIRLSEPALEQFGMRAAGKAAKFLTDTVKAVGESAIKYPKSFFTGEVIGGAGAGTLGGVSESEYPGQPGPRLAAEVVGGFFAPGRMLINNVGNAKSVLTGLLGSFSKESREGRAANKLYSILTDSGEDVDKVIKALEASTPAGIKATAGQKTGVRSLSILENSLARDSARYGADITEQGQKAILAYEGLIENLKRIGTPEALKRAAQMREDYYTQMIQGRLHSAEIKSAETIAKIGKDTPEAREKIGTLVFDNVSDALKEIRGHEKWLWNRALVELNKVSPKKVTRTEMVPNPKLDEFNRFEWEEAERAKGASFMSARASANREEARLRQFIPQKVTETVFAGRRISADETVKTFLQSSLDISNVVAAENTPALVKKIMAELGVDAAAITKYKSGRLTQEFADNQVVPDRYLPPLKQVDLSELVNMRSNLLELSRQASIKGDLSDARLYGTMAEGMLKDLGKIKSTSLDEARLFSKTLNDSFTRSFPAEMLAKKGTGAAAMPPETLVQQAFGSFNDLTSKRMREIESAVGLLRGKYNDAVTKFGPRSKQALELKPLATLADTRVVSIRDAHDRILRLGALKSIDVQTGRVDPRKLQTFVNENKSILDQMNITDDLTDAVKAENLFKATLDTNGAIQRGLRNQTAFAQVLRFESPSAAIADALNSKFKVRSFSGIAKLAKSGGPEAVEGLKSSVYDYAFLKAGGDTNFSPTAFNKAIFEPLSDRQPSLFNILRSQGVMSLQEGKNLKRLIDPMLKIEQSMGDRKLLEGVIQGADAATELGLRVVGARMGTMISRGENPLIAGQAGSGFMRNMFNKSPTIMVRGIIEEATKDPTMMALLLRRGRTEKEKLSIARSLNTYLGVAGLNYMKFEEPPVPPEEQRVDTSVMRPAQQSVTRRPLPPTVQSRGVPGFGTNAASAVPAPPPTGGNSREMLQKLFPYDATLR
jgi:hypothetical protein